MTKELDIHKLTQKALDLLNAKRNEAALEVINTVETLASDFPQIAYPKAVALARMSKTKEAIQLLQELLSKAPDHKYARALLAELEGETQEDPTQPQPSQSLEHSIEQPVEIIDEEKHEVIEEEKADIDQLINQALNELQSGSTQNALATIEKAKSFNIKAKDLYYVQAICLLQKGQIKEGVESLKQELKDNPDNEAAQQLLKTINTK